MISTNPLVNAKMEISQKETIINNATDGTIVVDRWIYNKIGSFQHTIARDNDVPSIAECGKLILNSYRLNLTTPQNNIGINDECVIVQKLEGYRFKEFAQQPFDLVFWVKADLVGTYCVSLRNNVPDLSCIGEFTINQPNKWEEKRITFPASPANGTWNYTDDIGLRLGIVVMAGNKFLTSGGTWNNGYFHKTANQINGVQSGAVNFRMTDFDIVEVGADRHKDRSYFDEYNLCRRYFRRYNKLPFGAKILCGIVDASNQATFDLQCEGMAKISNINIYNMGVYDTTAVSNILNVSSWFASDNIVNFSVLTNGGLTPSKPSKLRSVDNSSFLDITTI